MVQNPRTLQAIRVVDQILKLTTETTDEQIEKALSKIGTATGTWGLLWGLGNIRTSGLDVDLYELKAQTLRFIQELRKDRRYPTVIIAAAHMRRDESEV